MCDRLAFAAGKNGKPSILISASFDLYVGNLTNEEISLSPGELCGFNTGSFDVKIIRGEPHLLNL